jgi:predicted RNA-binding protein YlqC (UPF0109 family)
MTPLDEDSRGNAASAAAPNAKAMIEHIVRSLVDAPQSVLVDQFNDQGEIVLELEVAPTDIGKVIGRQGSVVKAMRSLVRAIGDKQDRDYALEIVED